MSIDLKIRNKLLLILCFLSMLSNFLFAQQLFNNKLSAEELEQLDRGEILIRNIGKSKNMCLNPVNAGAQKVIDTIVDLKPAYLAEVIQIRPYKGNEHLISDLKPILLDIEGYVGIPYWSERGGAFYDLYSSASIVSNNIGATGGDMNIDLNMAPFGDLNMNISLTNSDNELFYLMSNTHKVKYQGINIVKEENMQSIVYAFRYEDSIVLYGVGGVDAFSIFFLRDRIETSFINRIKTFCQFIFEKL